MASEPGGTPRWLWPLIFALAALQPLVHGLILYVPPAGTVATGLHIPDSTLFIESMDMFPSGFASPYATCQAEGGPASITYYNVPHLWLYGLLGLLARLLPLDPFMTYGFASGLGVAFYLWAVYALLRTAVPRLAPRAFLIFALGAGPGGVLYLLAGLFGLHGHPDFETYFLRFALYDLMEGPHFNPATYYPRLYYTLSLGACLGGLAALIRYGRSETPGPPWAWMATILAGTFINARYGVFVGGLLTLYLACGASPGRRVRMLAAYALPGGLGFAAAWLLLHTNPAVVENVYVMGNMAVWFSPFLLVTALPLALGARPLWRCARRSDMPWVRALVAGLLGYLAAYGVGYLLYQGYYGNLLTGRDGSVAAAVSDGALAGFLAGAWWGWRAPTSGREADESHGLPDWIVLWCLGFAALSLSGFGQGWFLRFGPQRLQVLIWLPLAILAAAGLAAMAPRPRRGLTALLLTFGITSVLVATFCFQGPVGRRDALGPWPVLHPEIMADADARLLDALGEGTVLAPLPAGDVAVRRRGNGTVFGVGTFNLTNVPYLTVRQAVDDFFAPGTDDAIRREIVADWCVDWVFVPHTWPVPEATARALEATPWLEQAAQEGRGALYRVRDAATTP